MVAMAPDQLSLALAAPFKPSPPPSDTSLLPDSCALELFCHALQLERQKIEAFKRELPFCMQLLDHAIDASRGKQFTGDRSAPKFNTPLLQLLCNRNVHSNLRSGCRPVLGELTHFKRNWEAHIDEGERETKRVTNWQLEDGAEAGADKTDLGIWHWNSSTVHEIGPEKDSSPKQWFSLHELVNREVLEPKYSGRSVKGVDESSLQHETYQVPTSSTEQVHADKLNDVIIHDHHKKEANPPTARTNSSGQQPQRKPRRCWSLELHQRFLKALEHLGGSQVATPKQIREFMNVDGLTNDEVKSHLQKFRLHMNRSIPISHTDPQQGSHLVVFGSIWVPPREFGNRSSAASQQALELFDSSVQKSDGISYSEHEQPRMVCHNLMKDVGPHENGTVESDEEARTSSCLNELEEDEKTQNHLEKFKNSPKSKETNPYMEKPTSNSSGDDTSQRSSAKLYTHRTLELQSFLTAPGLMNLTALSSQQQTASRERELEAFGNETLSVATKTAKVDQPARDQLQ